MTVSVVICAYTEERWTSLLRAVSSVHSQTRPAEEIVVVVDHNPSLLRRVRRELPGLQAVENQGAAGLASARNAGVDACTGSIVAFLDDDAQARPDWLERLTTAYTDRDVIATGGSIEPVWEGGRPRGFPEEFDWVVGCTYRGMPTRTSVVRNLIGANMSFRRGALLRAGGFKPGMGRVGTRPVGCEETDLCIRAATAIPGGKIVYDPMARVWHDVPPQRGRWTYFKARCYAEGLSKATVARGVGLDRGLASERAHAARALPRAVGRGVRDALRGVGKGHRRPSLFAWPQSRYRLGSPPCVRETAK